MDILIITAANAKYFDLVQGTILSIRQKPEGKNVNIGFFDLGCTSEQVQWLEKQVNLIKHPNWEFDFPGRNEAPEHFKGLLARPFLRRYFPNFEVYFWIDADAWVQDWQAIDLFIQGAKKQGLAIVPEIDRSSHIQYGELPEGRWQWVFRRYQEAFGEEVANKLYSYPLLNAGVFALHKDAPHWEIWAECLQQGLQQSVSLMTDQFALNLAVYNRGLFEQTELLPAWCNWTCHSAAPAWNKEKSCLVEPYLPHTTIGIIHLTYEKYDRVELLSTDKDLIEVSLRYSENSLSSKGEAITIKKTETTNENQQANSLPLGDYVSPGCEIVRPDDCFPNMIIGNRDNCNWPYLRGEIPHNWYADRRYPNVGFVSRDEAHILYNTALKFQGKKALEIGCWLGWSACHLALAGVRLDIIDPILMNSEIYESVSNSLTAAKVIDSVKLIKGFSPLAVEELVNQLQTKWSLIFIDGDHEAPAPLLDAIVCEQFAEPDAIILFHDLTSPDVTQGLDYLKQRGWNTMIYQTMQIMGVAWRGNVEPFIHQPDPNIQWNLPLHLQQYPVSGIDKNGKRYNQSLATIESINLVGNISLDINFNYPEFDTKQVVELLQKGKAGFIAGNLAEALQEFTKAVQLNPLSWMGNKYLSLIHWQKGNLKISLKHYLIAAESSNLPSSYSSNDEFLKLIAAVRSYTMLSQARLFSLYNLAKQICLDDIPGNFVECGTWRGGTAAMLAFVIKHYSLRPRILYVFDTFAGMPDPTEADQHDGIPANDTGLGSGTLKASILDGLDVVCKSLDVRDIVIPVQGLFADTLPQYKSEINNIALLHADGDWYQSTMDIFNNLFDRVVDDGIIQIDDYGFWEGCRKAIHEIERAKSMTFALRQIDDTGVWFRKENKAEYDAWRGFWFLAETAEKMGDVMLAQKAAQATLKLISRLLAAEEMLSRLRQPSFKEELNLRNLNLILFPDWSQPEELLLPEIKTIMRGILTHPERDQITLLIVTGDREKESAEMAISGIVMEILYEDDLDISQEPEISFLGQLSKTEWSTLRQQINSKITINSENSQAITEAEMANLPVWEIEN
ncbi:class I SAM-dependent methyltransferase [[Phormidium] sp. LEGE 05292]|uniref:class I SAM-dependent methyltransferase n=1 Tax=[Phormidium] sp. LEGE 05292 TaxID=767427 RepID=UPI001D139DB1|nr:TylF/MycF/NovP-related O-methyltransferase [Phormidium sp. LEGE 05292]